MFDIYSVTPNAVGALNHVLVAGNYKNWADVTSAILILNRIVESQKIIPIFEVQICTHRKTSTQYKTTTTHTAPMTEDDLFILL